MKQISLWAFHNKAKARIAIIGGKIILFLLAYFVGKNLQLIQIHLPTESIFVITLIITATAFCLYPNAKKRTGFQKKAVYLKQKTFDFIFAFSSFLVVVIITNNQTKTFLAANYTFGYSIERTPRKTADEILSSLKDHDSKSLTRKEKKILKNEFFRQLKIYAVAKLSGNKANGEKAALIILTIVAALGLMYLLSALVCNLSCSGSDFAAILVGILGTAAIIWGVIALIKRINRGPKNKPS